MQTVVKFTDKFFYYVFGYTCDSRKNFTCSIVSKCLIDIVHIFITDGLI
jgi:hypothetical protein